jgi:hypothetical protein
MTFESYLYSCLIETGNLLPIDSIDVINIDISGDYVIMEIHDSLNEKLYTITMGIDYYNRVRSNYRELSLNKLI